jgi:hypothetical protein
VGPSFLSFTPPTVLVTGNAAILAVAGWRPDGPSLCTNAALEVFRLSGRPLAPSSSWCAPEGGSLSPIITTTDGVSEPILWTTGMSPQNTGALVGYAPDTGERVIRGIALPDAFPVAAPIVAGGRFVTLALDSKGNESLLIFE